MLEQYKQRILEAIDGHGLYQDIEIKDNIIEVFLTSDTTDFNKEQYDEWYRLVENTGIGDEDYSIEFHTDGSGYEYWFKQSESNWVNIYCEIHNLNDDNIENFVADLYDMMEQYAEIEESCKWYGKKNTWESKTLSSNDLIKKLRESIAEDDDEEELDLTDEARAVAKYLEIPETDVEDVESDDYYDYLYKVEAKKDGKKHIYYVSSDEYDIKRGVEDSLESLFDDLTVPEFCEKVIPYLSGSIEDYLSVNGEWLTDSEGNAWDIEAQLDDGALDGVWGRDFQGSVDFDKMADDVISQYGAGHELAPYDNKTMEQDYDGVTYYIFKQDEEDLNESLKESEEKTFDELEKEGKDISDISHACCYVYYGFYADKGRKMTPSELVKYFEDEIEKSKDDKFAKFYKNWAGSRFPEALEIVKRWIKKNA